MVPDPGGDLERLRRLAFWLDEGIRIPGTRIRFGLDPLLGLVPGIGDAVGVLLGAGILVEAARRGVSRYTLARMALNLAVDAAVGAVPLLGDVFDAGWKAHSRNLALLERHARAPARGARRDRLVLVGLVGALLALGVGLAALGVLVTAELFRWMGGPAS